MPSKTSTIWGLFALLACLAGCSSDSATQSSPNLRIQLNAMNSGQAPCEIGRIATVDQSRNQLYMVRGEGIYRLDGGQSTDIPVQIQFRGLEGVVEDRAITGPELDAACDQLAIEFTIESCQNQSRELIECPPFDINGQEAFRAFSLEFESKD